VCTLPYEAFIATLMWDAKNIQPNSVCFLIIMSLISSPANQRPTKYHIHMESSTPTEIKQHVRGDITDVKGTQTVKSTARFIKLCGLNTYTFSSKLSWLSSNRTPNLLRNSTVSTLTVLTLVMLEAANLNNARDGYCGRQVLAGS